MQKVDYQHLPLDTNEREAFKYQERRHAQWRENYELNRDKVITNRLTQRQSVNLPLMKSTIKTILANTDEFTPIEFEDKGNDKDKELFFNAYWNDYVVTDKLELKDYLDKKQELLYGRTWMRLNIKNGRIVSEVLEPWDVLVDRYVDPTDLETANYLIQGNIFRTLGDLSENPSYDKEAVKRLKMFYGTKAGLIKSEDVTRMLEAKNERLVDMGLPDAASPLIGQTIVELKHHYVKVWDDQDGEFHWHIIVRCDHEQLMAKPLKEVLGIDFLPFVTWADDIERNDFYSDGVADIVRTPNKVLNVWISQLIENRTLRNFGMNFYDTSVNDNWVPQSFEPRPGGWYPLPGKPSDVYQKVDVPDLTESLDEMNFLKAMIESATAATAATKGESEKGKVTLGEVELTVQAAKERMSSIAKFSMLARKEFADKWAALANANADKLDAVKLYKKSHKNNWFKKTVTPDMWKSADGYTCRAVSASEQEQKGIETIQKLKAIRGDFNPMNEPLRRITQERELKFAGLTPDETSEVMDAEKNAPMIPGLPGPAAPQMPGMEMMNAPGPA